MEKLTRSCIFLVLALLMLSGCGNTENNLLDDKEVATLDCSSATNDESVLPDYVINISDIRQIEEKKCSLSEFAFEDKVYYVLEYAHDGAQYAYKYEIYEDDNGAATLLYSSDTIVWLNEFTIHMGNLFWVEFSVEKDYLIYSIIQFDLGKKEKICLAEYSSNDVAEILLTAGDGYLAWYENYGDIVNLQYFDIKNSEIHSYDNKAICVTSAYDRAEIVDSAISFFVETNGIKSIVNLQLKTHKEKEIVALNNDKFAGYVANSKSIVWFTNYINGNCFLYDIKNDELSQIAFPKGINIFSLHSDKNAVYFNMRGDKNYLLVLNNDKTITKMFFSDAFAGTHFGRNKYGSYIKLEGTNIVGVKCFY